MAIVSWHDETMYLPQSGILQSAQFFFKGRIHIILLHGINLKAMSLPGTMLSFIFMDRWKLWNPSVKQVEILKKLSAHFDKDWRFLIPVDLRGMPISPRRLCRFGFT